MAPGLPLPAGTGLTLQGFNPPGQGTRPMRRRRRRAGQSLLSPGWGPRVVCRDAQGTLRPTVPLGAPGPEPRPGTGHRNAEEEFAAPVGRNSSRCHGQGHGASPRSLPCSGAKERRVPCKDRGVGKAAGDKEGFFLLSIIMAGRRTAGRESFRAVQLL